MSVSFSAHCLLWKHCSPLIKDFCLIVRRAGGNCDELLDQNYEEDSRHALAISSEGLPIGYARLGDSGDLDRMVIVPGEDIEQISFALQQILQRYANQESAYA